MRKLITFLVLLTLSTAGISQSTTTLPGKTDYLKKSNSQKTTAWLLACGGVGTVVIAYASYNYGDLSNVFAGDNQSINTKGAFLVIGGLTALSSIPFFITSARNKRKSMGLSFKNEISPQLLKNSFVYRSIPSLSLKISL